VITSKRCEIGCQLVLITNRKSHTGFISVPISVTLNGLEWRNSPYFCVISTNLVDLEADYVTWLKTDVQGSLQNILFQLHFREN